MFARNILNCNLNVSNSVKICQYFLTCTYSTQIEALNHLRKVFSNYNKPNFYEKSLEINSNIAYLKKASVLVSISYNEFTKSYYYTLTKRTDDLRTHKGQICFPGGMRDATDVDDIHTAFREANEEVGIENSSLEFLSQLIPVCTTDGVLLTPIIAYFDKTNFKPNINTDEVDFMFEVDTKRFLSNDNHKSTLLGNGKELFYMHGFNYRIDNRDLNIYGVTAYLCVCISCILHAQIPNFDIDPQEKLNNSNLNEFMENYLLVKSKRLINQLIAKKLKK